jgi:hypothetical protein
VAVDKGRCASKPAELGYIATDLWKTPYETIGLALRE